nr:DUF1493 family protein [uncultured Capnocytophaga sp.]
MQEEDWETLKKLIAKYTRAKELHLETSVNNELQIQGDDAVDFLMEYAETFRVDMSSFCFDAYFYNEGALSSIWIMKLLGMGKKKQPLYISQLMDAIERKSLR